MINFSAVPSERWIGRLLRRPLRWLPGDMVVPIVQGPLRGRKWIVGSATHGSWLGSYEYGTQRIFRQFVGRGDVVYDLGANVGFYTLLGSVLVGPPGVVVAVEPFLRNVAYLRRHLALNHVRNVIVVEGAVHEVDGVVGLVEGPDPSQVRVGTNGSVRVRAFTLDRLVFRDGLPAPSVVKLDVEGAECAVLRGATRLLRERRPLLVLSTHGSEVHAACCRLLLDAGYALKPLDGDRVERASTLLGCPQ